VLLFWGILAFLCYLQYSLVLLAKAISITLIYNTIITTLSFFLYFLTGCYNFSRTIGRVSEWSMEMVLKTIVPATVPWVRIPPLPPIHCHSIRGIKISTLWHSTNILISKKKCFFMKKTIATKTQQRSTYRSGFRQSLQTGFPGLYSNAFSRLNLV